MALPHGGHSPEGTAGEPRGSMQQRLRDTYAQEDEVPSATRFHLSPLRRGLLMICILIGFFFSVLDTTIVSTSLLAASQDLKGFRDGFWVVLAYLLSYMGFSSVSAKLSDIFGRRNILLVSWLIFAVLSVACGCAVNMTQLIFCRAFQGIGGAGLYSLTTIALPEIGPADKPHIIGSMVAVTLSMSFILGPILGGLITQNVSWRLIYWMNTPACFVATVGLIFLYPTEMHTLRGDRSLRRVDFLGSVLLLATTILLVFAMQQAGSLTVAWNSVPIIAILTASALSWILFCVFESWLSYKDRQVEPLFPLRLAGKRVYLACLVTTFLVGSVYLSLILTLPERFQIVNGDDSQTAGFHLMPMLGGTALGCFICGPLNAKKNRTSVVLVASCALMLIGTTLFMCLRDTNTTIKAQYGFQATFGLGFGLFVSAGTMMATAQAPLGDHAVAQGAISQARVLGGLIGLSICTIILNVHVQADLANKLSPEQLNVLHQSPSAMVKRWPELGSLIRDTYATAFTFMVKAMVCVAAAALVFSLLGLEKNPPAIHGALASNKEFPPSRGHSAVELDDLGSDRSMLDFVEPLPPDPISLPKAHYRDPHGRRLSP